MKFCQKCGKEIMDEAVVCTECGCAVDEVKTQAMEKKKTNKKKILIAAGALVALVILIVAGKFFITYNPIRAMQVKKQLAGKSFSYVESTYYSYSQKKLIFDDDADCTESSYYLSDSSYSTGELSLAYKIKFKDGMVFLVDADDSELVYEIQYDRYGNIESIYDMFHKRLYD